MDFIPFLAVVSIFFLYGLAVGTLIYAGLMFAIGSITWQQLVGDLVAAAGFYGLALLTKGLLNYAVARRVMDEDTWKDLWGKK